VNRSRVIAGALGTLATLLAAAAAFAPGLPGVGGLADAVRAGGGGRLLVGASGFLVLYLAWLARAPGPGGAPTGPDEGDPFEAALSTPPEGATAAGPRRVGASMAVGVDAATSGQESALAAVRDRLRETAVDAHARARDCDRAAARAAVADGSWTNDPVAAAALADADGPEYGVGARLRLWLDPERERERRLRRTVDAIRRLAGGEE